MSKYRKIARDLKAERDQWTRYGGDADLRRAGVAAIDGVARRIALTFMAERSDFEIGKFLDAAGVSQ